DGILRERYLIGIVDEVWAGVFRWAPAILIGRFLAYDTRRNAYDWRGRKETTGFVHVGVAFEVIVFHPQTTNFLCLQSDAAPAANDYVARDRCVVGVVNKNATSFSARNGGTDGIVRKAYAV